MMAMPNLACYQCITANGNNIAPCIGWPACVADTFTAEIMGGGMDGIVDTVCTGLCTDDCSATDILVIEEMQGLMQGGCDVRGTPVASACMITVRSRRLQVNSDPDPSEETMGDDGMMIVMMLVGFDLGMSCPMVPEACAINPAVCIDCDAESCPPDENGNPAAGCTLRPSYAEAAIMDGTGATYLNGKCNFFVDEASCIAPTEGTDENGQATQEPSMCAWVDSGCTPTADALATMEMVFGMATGTGAFAPCNPTTDDTCLCTMEDVTAAMAAEAAGENPMNAMPDGSTCMNCMMGAQSQVPDDATDAEREAAQNVCLPEGSDGPPACVASQFEGICDQTTGDCDDMAVVALVCGTGGATLDTGACAADEIAQIEMARSQMCACATQMGACGASTDCPPLWSAVMDEDGTSTPEESMAAALISQTRGSLAGGRWLLWSLVSSSFEGDLPFLPMPCSSSAASLC